MQQDIAARAVERNSNAITFRPASRLSFRAIVAERAGLSELYRSTDDEALRRRVAQRAMELSSQIYYRFGPGLVA